MMVNIPGSIPRVLKVASKAIPVMIPGRAMGRISISEMPCLPKKSRRYRAAEGHAERLQGEALGRKAEGRVFGVEGVEEDDQDREVQEHQPAPGRQAQAQGGLVAVLLCTRAHRRPPGV